VDSIAITYALLDPILTVMRPVAAFFTAAVAGIAENLSSKGEERGAFQPDLSCPIDGCCDGVNCSPHEHARHHAFFERLKSGVRYAFTDFWNDLAGYFFLGLFLAGLITVLIPESFFTAYVGAGFSAMLIMLAAGIPLYVCATASTPIAAALILKGVSPGAALVFLLVGPATNMAALTVLIGTLGKRSTAVYLASIALCAVLFGLAVDEIYGFLGISAQAVMGQAAETIPHWLALTGSLILVVLSIRPLWRIAKKPFSKRSAPPPSEPVIIQPSIGGVHKKVRNLPNKPQ
jgi:uncharacterized membrane protein YraQ (UPF0718 family)